MALQITYTPNPRLEDELLPGLRALLMKLTSVGADAVRAVAPRGPERDPPQPHLADNVITYITGTGRDLSGFVVLNVPHGLFVEVGTPPHVIQARGRDNGGADALYWKGADHPVFSVQHPGTKPNPLLRKVAMGAIRSVLS
jgi:hypothetical protein